MLMLRKEGGEQAMSLRLQRLVIWYECPELK